MSEEQDIRWKQRLTSLLKAYHQLDEAVKQTNYSNLEKQGVIQSFEYTYELASKTLQDLLIYTGYPDIRGPRPVILQAHQNGYIKDGTGWMAMLKARNLTTHTYDEQTAEEILLKIKGPFFQLFSELIDRLNKEAEQ